MLIIKCWEMIPDQWELIDFAEKRGLRVTDLIGKRMSIRYKDGKKKKLKRFTLLDCWTVPCECCGRHNYATFRMGGKEITREW
jgi:hypothetical protein